MTVKKLKNEENFRKISLNFFFNSNTLLNNILLKKNKSKSFKNSMKKVDNISISKSKSNSPFSEKLQKKSLINNYSRSTFNMINDLYLNDETNENKIQKTEKVQNILNSKNQNFLQLHNQEFFSLYLKKLNKNI